MLGEDLVLLFFQLEYTPFQGTGMDTMAVLFHGFGHQKFISTVKNVWVLSFIYFL